MSGILFLNHNDFEVKKGEKGDMMTLKYDKTGLTLVLFYSKELPTCEHLMIQFKQLPSKINGCNFAMVNMNKNMELVNMSRNTIAPITYVPDLTLFVNGCPFIRYDGEQEIEAIRKFLEEIYEKIKKLQFSQTQQPTTSPPPTTPKISPDQVKFNQSPRQQPIPNQDPKSINQFYNPLQQQQQQQQYPPMQQQPILVTPVNQQPPIPAYTIGIPKSGDPKRSYKTFDNAYSTKV